MSTPAIRAALERLIELDKVIHGISGIIMDDWTDAIAAARTALAQPVGEGPSDEELIDWHSDAYCPDVDEVNDEEDSMFQHTSAYLRWVDEHGTQKQRSAHEAKGLRAVFEAGQRYGVRPAPPAPEVWEVGELEQQSTCKQSLQVPPNPVGEVGEGPSAAEIDAAWLSTWNPELNCYDVAAFARAILARWGRPATLLSQQAPPAPEVVPVAASERLPDSRPESEGGDCDEAGRCWWFTPPACGPHNIRPCWTLDSEVMDGDTHWRPFYAIPLPQAGEVPHA
jgi:hypothetical protein